MYTISWNSSKQTGDSSKFNFGKLKIIFHKRFSSIGTEAQNSLTVNASMMHADTKHEKFFPSFAFGYMSAVVFSHCPFIEML